MAARRRKLDEVARREARGPARRLVLVLAASPPIHRVAVATGRRVGRRLASDPAARPPDVPRRARPAGPAPIEDPVAAWIAREDAARTRAEHRLATEWAAASRLEWRLRVAEALACMSRRTARPAPGLARQRIRPAWHTIAGIGARPAQRREPSGTGPSDAWDDVSVVIAPGGRKARNQARLLREAGVASPVVAVAPDRVAEAVVEAERSVVLVLHGLAPQPATALAPLVEALRDDPGLGAATCAVTAANRIVGGPHRFRLDGGVPVPIPVAAGRADEQIGTLDGAAVALRPGPLKGLGLKGRYRGRGWALEAGVLLRAAGRELAALPGALPGLPEESDVSRADTSAFIQACGPLAFRRVALDLLHGGGLWACERLRVFVDEPGGAGAAAACSQLGWELTGHRADAHLRIDVTDGGLTAWWSGGASEASVEESRLAGTEMAFSGGSDPAALRRTLADALQRPSFAIRLGARDGEAARRWGDHGLADALRAALASRGAAAIVVAADRDDDLFPACFDVALHIRGRGPGRVRSGQVNLAWLISHPDETSHADLERYDAVLVASPQYARTLAGSLRTPVHELLQFTDPSIFCPERDASLAHEVLFVGNWRSVFRPIVWDALCAGRSPAIYGEGWRYLLPDHVRRARVERAELRRLYSSCRVLLNDHWDDMRRHGFVSNRVFDALACGAYVVSDDSHGVRELFGDAVPTYRSLEELRAAIDEGLHDERARRQRVDAGRALVLERHTGDHRAAELLQLARACGADCDRPAVAGLRLGG